MRVRAALLAVPAFCAFTLLPAWAGQPIRPLKEQVASGKMLFDLRGCSTCHSVMGKGGGGAIKAAQIYDGTNEILRLVVAKRLTG